MAEIHCTVVTPEATALDAKARFVVVPFEDGEKGIGIGHAPLIGRLGAGELRLKSDSTTLRYFVDRGFVQVVDNEVSITTGLAIPASELSADVLREQLNAALQQSTSDRKTIEERDFVVRRLRAQLRVATR